MTIDHQKIAQRFAKAGQNYEQSAVVQKQVIDRLMVQFAEQCGDLPCERVLEIGCGNGLLTRQFLAYKSPKRLYLNDLYLPVRHDFLSANQAVDYVIGDIAMVDLPDELDLVLSTSALQWVADLQALFGRLSSVMTTNGVLAFSTFGEQNLWQIKHLTGKGLSYPTPDMLIQMLNQAGFSVLYQQAWQQTLFFDTPMAVLKHLQMTGVTASDGDYRWNKQKLQQFGEQYQSLSCEQGLPLTYDPIIIIAKMTKK